MITELEEGKDIPTKSLARQCLVCGELQRCIFDEEGKSKKYYYPLSSLVVRKDEGCRSYALLCDGLDRFAHLWTEKSEMVNICCHGRHHPTINLSLCHWKESIAIPHGRDSTRFLGILNSLLEMV